MGPRTIVSYDDTLNDHDATALGRVLADAGAQLELAYVRHTTASERSREELEEHEAEALLERGARWLGDLDVPRRVVLSASTGEGLAWLAEQEQADVVVFGSDYRPPAGRRAPVAPRAGAGRRRRIRLRLPDRGGPRQPRDFGPTADRRRARGAC